MAEYCKHLKRYVDDKLEYYFLSLTIPNLSTLKYFRAVTVAYSTECGSKYFGSVQVLEKKITFSIHSTIPNLRCFVSMFIDAKTLLLSNSVNECTSTSYSDYINLACFNYDLLTFVPGERFQKRMQHPNDTLTFICKIKLENPFPKNSFQTFVNTSLDSPYRLKTIAAAVRQFSGSLSDEKILLRVGEESETVSKTILCAQSSVFAKMFENDMRETREKTVTITDIKMPVLKALVSFLYDGKLPTNCDFDFVCGLYYAAEKYAIIELRQLCRDLLLHQISIDNVILLWKFADSYDDALLKSAAIASIATNFEEWSSTDKWKNLVNDEPKIATEVLLFFEF